MSFFGIPVSGLNASQSALQAVSQNLANSDTDGYKDQNVTFADMFAQSGISNGAGDPIQPGAGVLTASTTSNFSNGTVTATNIPSNMALQGNGFFVVQQLGGNIAYSRAGDFTQNNSGQLVAPDGSLVMGFPATAGVVNTAAPLQPLSIGTGLTLPAVATSNFTANINLDASAAVGATASSPITVFDSLGAQQQLTINYTKTAANTWTYSVTIPSSALANPASSTAPTQTLTTSPAAGASGTNGTLTFDASGNLISPTVTSATTPPVTTPAPISIQVPGLADGAAGMNISWNLANATGGSNLGQAALASSTTSVVANGQAAGTLSDYTIEADGTIQGSLSNGSTVALGQVAVASVVNTQGLAQVGNNLFQATSGSGPAEIGVAGTGGRGTITGGSIEESNVDVASEFSKMIVAQQAYEANAKAVTTFDQVSQATLAMLQS